jgi:outer membrane protein assembly factor BamD (BamD/ComL family)
MISRVVLLLAAVPVCFLTSCGQNGDLPPPAGAAQASAGTGEALYQQARQQDQAGRTKRALKLYDQVATHYPFAPSAPQARFRQAEILEQQGDVLKAFEAYQKFLTRFQGSGLYSTALNRQAAMAQAAAEGEVRSSFLGLRSRLSVERVAEMLGKVRDNAPKSRTASKAQFTIAELYQGKGKSKEAIAAYRQLVRDQPESPEAPEASFRVGLILTQDADRGNRNQATLDLAREAFNDYLTQYPGHRRAPEARRLIGNLGGRELQRAFDVAEFYRRTGQVESAKVYYRDVARRAGSGPLHDQARARLRELGES